MCVISDVMHTYPNRNRYVVRDTDLLIKKGDIVIVLDASRKDRWHGVVNQKQVFFPAWVVEYPSLLSSHGMTSDCTEDETSISEPEKRNGGHSDEQPCCSHALLQVATLPEPGGSENQPSLSDIDASHTEPELLGSDPKHSITFCQTSSLADLEVVTATTPPDHTECKDETSVCDPEKGSLQRSNEQTACSLLESDDAEKLSSLSNSRHTVTEVHNTPKLKNEQVYL